MPVVDLFEEIELRPLVVARDVLGPREIENRRARGAKQRALVARRQKSGAPIQRAAFHSAAVSKDDVAGEILTLAAEPVRDPRARARKAGPRDACIDLIE